MRIRQLLTLLMLASATFIAGPALAVSRGSNSGMRQMQKMQMQYMQMRMQQAQAAAQSHQAEREHRRQLTREAAQRERDAKDAAAHKSSDKPLGVAAKSDDDKGKKLDKGGFDKSKDKPVDNAKPADPKKKLAGGKIAAAGNLKK